MTMKSARTRPNGRSRTRRALAVFGLILAAFVFAFALGATSASAGTWYPTGVIVNQTGSTENNCPGSVNGLPAGCITVDSTNVVDGSWTVPPGTVAASGGAITSPFQYIAPNLDEGADASINITAPHGSQWTLAQFDDVSWFPGTNNYTSSCSLTTPACTETTAQGSAYSCDPNWASSPPFSAVPSVTFWPVAAASNISTGQQCASALTAGQTFNCVGTGLGQFAPVRVDDNITSVYYENLSNNATTMNASTISPCVMPSAHGGGRIAYRTSAAGTTVLTFARRDGRRWVTLPGVARASWLHRDGKPTFTVRGHTASREGTGSHRHAWNGTVAGRRLAPGRYRVTAVSRGRGTTRVSRATSATFTIRPLQTGSRAG